VERGGVVNDLAETFIKTGAFRVLLSGWGIRMCLGMVLVVVPLFLSHFLSCQSSKARNVAKYLIL
jgi:hypothetical protein